MCLTCVACMFDWRYIEVCYGHVLQFYYMLLVAVSLVLRTYADVWMIENGTAIERSDFTHNIYLYALVSFSFSGQ